MTATPASHPFEIREHDAGPVHVIGMRGELDLALTAHGRRMAVAAPGDSAVGRLFDLAGAHELLEIHADCDAALAALAPREP